MVQQAWCWRRTIIDGREKTKANGATPTMSLMRSPLARQRVMLSSSTVFMFSIHSASIGPSNTVHLPVKDNKHA